MLIRDGQGISFSPPPPARPIVSLSLLGAACALRAQNFTLSLTPYFPQLSLISLFPTLSFPSLTRRKPLISYSLPFPPLADSKPILRNLAIWNIRSGFLQEDPLGIFLRANEIFCEKVYSTHHLAEICFCNHFVRLSVRPSVCPSVNTLL